MIKMKSVNVKLDEKDFKLLQEAKMESGLTWEEFFMKVCKDGYYVSKANN